MKDVAADASSTTELMTAWRQFDYARVDVGASRAELPAASFDAVIDIVGVAPLRALRRLIGPGGCVIMVSGEGGRLLGPIGRMLRAGLLSLGRGSVSNRSPRPRSPRSRVS